MFAFLLCGCDRAVISGTVTDIQGLPLPGVAVIANTGNAQTLTDALGRYTLSAPRNVAGIRLIKDGYTSGYLELQSGQSGSFAVRTVALWHLPPGAGVYLVEDYLFRATTPGEPKPYATDKGPVYAVHVVAPIEKTTQTKPLIICHKMPAYDVRLARLRNVQVTGPDGGFDVWAAETNSPVEAVPIDEPERYLVEIRLAEPLTPGTYALHWGALDGRTSTESRTFLFVVEDPNKPSEAAPPEARPAPEKPSAEKPPAPPVENVDTSAADAEAEAPQQ